MCKEFSSSVEIEIAGRVRKEGSGESTCDKRVARGREATSTPILFCIDTDRGAYRLSYGKNLVAVVGWFTFHGPTLQKYHKFVSIVRATPSTEQVRVSLSRVRNISSAGLAILSAILCMRVL